MKAYPQEKVGVFVRRGKGGPVSVVEYSELDSSMASAINQETGRLRYCWSNVRPTPYSFCQVPYLLPLNIAMAILLQYCQMHSRIS